jgi:hypothetical protein
MVKVFLSSPPVNGRWIDYVLGMGAVEAGYGGDIEADG